MGSSVYRRLGIFSFMDTYLDTYIERLKCPCSSLLESLAPIDVNNRNSPQDRKESLTLWLPLVLVYLSCIFVKILLITMSEVYEGDIQA